VQPRENVAARRLRCLAKQQAVRKAKSLLIERRQHGNQPRRVKRECTKPAQSCSQLLGHELAWLFSHAAKLNHGVCCRRYDYQLVRTDSRAQTLDAFVVNLPVQDVDSVRDSSATAGSGGPAATHPEPKRKGDVAADADDWDPIRQRPRKKKRADPPPSAGTAASTDDCDCATGCGCAPRGFFGGTRKGGGSAGARDNTAGLTDPKVVRRVLKWPESACDLTSIIDFRLEAVAKQSEGLRALFAEHTFVGCIDESRALIQFRTKL
jgi:hypothetical protein